MGNKKKKVINRQQNHKEQRINNLKNGRPLRWQSNAAALPAQIPEHVNSISVNSVNTTSDNCNGDHPPLGRKKTTEMLLEEAEKITTNLPNKRIRKGVLCCQPSLPTPVAGGISQSQSDIPIPEDSVKEISELDQTIMEMTKTFVNVGGKNISFDMWIKFLV